MRTNLLKVLVIFAMAWAATEVNAGVAVGEIPPCLDNNIAGCFDAPGTLCSQFAGAYTCYDMTLAPEGECAVADAVCTTSQAPVTCSGDKVWIECSFVEGPGGDERGDSLPN